MQQTMRFLYPISWLLGISIGGHTFAHVNMLLTIYNSFKILDYISFLFGYIILFYNTILHISNMDLFNERTESAKLNSRT